MAITKSMEDEQARWQQVCSDIGELATAFLYLSATVSKLDIRVVPTQFIIHMEEADRRVKDIANRYSQEESVVDGN